MPYRKSIIFLLTVFILPSFSCGKTPVKNSVSVGRDSSGNTVRTRFSVPSGYIKVTPKKNSFADYLQNLPLKRDGAKVYYYDGREKTKDVHAGVVDIDIGKKDLQQCADAIMRLRAEYLYGQELYDDIHFNFTSGFNAEYSKWREGYRIIINGNKVSWSKKFGESTTYEEFRSYLDIVFTYAGTLSLEKELKPKKISEMEIGDVFIKGGSPGHAVIVVDMAVNEKTGEKIFLLAQSYMPAQNIHILKNPVNPDLSPWYSSDFGETLETPEWSFKNYQLKYF
ncbi:MAG: DUF4846 domain-containing protein [Ignavibacteriae bacterium]|nr:DUF4846 domain-containing protein [Ignavibacteriota bacterium]